METTSLNWIGNVFINTTLATIWHDLSSKKLALPSMADKHGKERKTDDACGTEDSNGFKAPWGPKSRKIMQIHV
jgi:hypothetical protein